MTSEPDNDPELDRQRGSIEAAFRDRWAPLDVTKPRILTGHVYNEARRFIGEQGRTWVDGVIIQAVRDGAQPGDELPPLRPEPHLGHITDAKVTLIGRGRGRRVAVLFPLADFPGAQFGHRFEPDPLAGNQEAPQLMQQIAAGASRCCSPTAISPARASATASRWSPTHKTTSRSGSWKRSTPAPCTA